MTDPQHELYRSIWEMTYAYGLNPPNYIPFDADPETHAALMEEQEDLLPNPLTEIEQVEKLDLGGFPDGRPFPELLRYKGLKVLHFWETELKELPEELFELTEITELYVCGSLKSLPESIGKWAQLEKLLLPGNQITHLPESITQLVNLRELDLSDNWISVFELDLTHFPKLERLYLSDNPGPLVLDWDMIQYCRQNGISLLV